MASRSLKNLSLVALVRPFFDSWEHDDRLPVSLRRPADYWPEAAIELGLKMQSLVPIPHLAMELKLVILEYVKRKQDRDHTRKDWSLPVEPPPRDKALQEFLPQYFFAAPGRKIRAPVLLKYFPERDHMTVITFFLALTQKNPRDDRSAMRACWTSDAFLPIQSIFLDNFDSIWRGIHESIDRQLEESTILEEFFALQGMKQGMFDSWSWHAGDVNVTVPWFVFEVLTEEQRDKFLAHDRSDLMGEPTFRMFFAAIFQHWPWRDEAFDRYFAKREILSDNETELLFYVKLHQLLDEDRDVERGMLPNKGCYADKLEVIVNKRNKHRYWSRNMYCRK